MPVGTVKRVRAEPAWQPDLAPVLEVSSLLADGLVVGDDAELDAGSTLRSFLPPGADATMTDVAQPSLTRAQRRRDRYTTTREDLSGPLVLVRALAVLAIAGLAVLAVHAGPLFVAGLLVWAAAGIAWGWPQVVALSYGWRLSFVVVLTGLLVGAAVVMVEDDPRLRLVPVALAIGIVVTFLFQLLRSDGQAT